MVSAWILWGVRPCPAAAGDRHLTRARGCYRTHWIWIDFGDKWIAKTIKLPHGIGACSRLMHAAAM